MALSFDVGMNERSAVASAKRLGDSLEDIDDKLDDLGKSKGAADLEKDMESLQREAKKTETAIDKVGDGGKSGFGKASGASSEFKNEALQNFSEVTSSFDGSMQSVGDLAQGTLGGIASSIPGIGLLGGAAAAGIGLITTELVNQAAQAELLRERLANAYIEAAQEGRNYISAAQAVQEAQDLMFNPERAGEWKQIQEDQKTLNLDIGVLIDANAGKTEAQAEVNERVNALIDEEKEAYNETDSIVGNLGTSVLGIKNRWDEVAAATQEQKDRAAELAEYTEGANEREREQIQRNRDASQARWEAYGSAAQAAAGTATSAVNSIPDRDVRLRVSLDSSAWDNWRPNPKTGVIMAQYQVGVNYREPV